MSALPIERRRVLFNPLPVRAVINASTTMTAFPQRRQTGNSPQQRQDSYVRLLAECTDNIENRVSASTSSLVLALLYSCYSWPRLLRSVLPSQIPAYSRQFYRLKMTGKVLPRCAGMARALPAMCITTIAGFVAVISFTWLW